MKNPVLYGLALAVAVVALVAGASFLVVQAFDDQSEALRSVEETAAESGELADARIAGLNDTIGTLEGRIATLNRQIDSLAEQVRSLGGDPVIVTRTVTVPAGDGSSGPPPETTTTEPCVTNPQGKCPEGRNR